MEGINMKAQITGFEPAMDEGKKEYVTVGLAVSLTQDEFNKLMKKTKGWGVEIDIKARK